MTFGIPALDQLVPSGQRNCVHGVIGAIGVGKTTLLQMVAAEGAKREFDLNPGKESGAWIFISTEEASRHVVAKMYSYLGALPRDMIEANRFEGESDDNESIPFSYRTWCEHSGCEPRLFQSRLIYATEVMRRICVIDLNDQRSPYGMSAMDFVNSVLERCAFDCPIRGICVDNLRLFVTRSNGNSKILLWEMRESFRSLRSGLLAQWNCPIWVSHHANEEQNDQTTRVPQHGSSQNLGFFSDFCDTVFSMGRADLGSGVFLIGCTKGAEVSTETVCCRFHPKVAKIETAPAFRIDHVREEIVGNTAEPGSIFRRIRGLRTNDTSTAEGRTRPKDRRLGRGKKRGSR